MFYEMHDRCQLDLSRLADGEKLMRGLEKDGVRLLRKKTGLLW